MAETSADEYTAAEVSVAPSVLWILVLCVPAVVAFLLPPLLVDLGPDTRWPLIGMAAVFAALGFAAWRNRLTVRGATLSQRDVLRFKTVELDGLVAVCVRRGAGQYTHPWELLLTDADGRRMTLRLNGYSVADRRRLMAALEPFAKRYRVRLDGPVEQALAGGLWFPHAPRPVEADP